MDNSTTQVAAEQASGASGQPSGARNNGQVHGLDAGSGHGSRDRGGSKVGLRDFLLLKVVGKGSFGKVMMVRKRNNGRIYAMKVLHKSHIIRRNQVEHTRTERSVLGKIMHPFIVSLNYAFQTPDKLYFVLDYCAGGELFFHLGREGRFSERRAQFYAGQITLALEHLHSLGIIYRDLKPENVLLDHRGNVRLTDFGLSKEGIHDTVSGAHSFCGTPEYLAPEILNRGGHGRAVDWWSLGALLYEMLTGLPPFYCKDRSRLFERIRRGTLEFPEDVSPVARDILSKLLERDPHRRMGCGDADADEVKSHPFFAGLDWRALYDCRIETPWQPDVTGSLDTSQFDSEFTSMPLVTPPSHAAGMVHDPRVDFEGFTFVGDGFAGNDSVPPTRARAASRAFGRGAAGVAQQRAGQVVGATSAASGTIPAGDDEKQMHVRDDDDEDDFDEEDDEDEEDVADDDIASEDSANDAPVFQDDYVTQAPGLGFGATTQPMDAMGFSKVDGGANRIGAAPRETAMSFSM